MQALVNLPAVSTPVIIFETGMPQLLAFLVYDLRLGTHRSSKILDLWSRIWRFEIVLMISYDGLADIE